MRDFYSRIRTGFSNSPIEDVVKKFMTNFYKQAVPNSRISRDFYETLIIFTILEKEVLLMTTVG